MGGTRRREWKVTSLTEVIGRIRSLKNARPWPTASFTDRSAGMTIHKTIHDFTLPHGCHRLDCIVLGVNQAIESHRRVRCRLDFKIHLDLRQGTASAISPSKLTAKLCSCSCPHSTILCPFRGTSAEQRRESGASGCKCCLPWRLLSLGSVWPRNGDRVADCGQENPLHKPYASCSTTHKIDQQRTKLYRLMIETRQAKFHRRAHERLRGHIDLDTRPALPWNVISLAWLLVLLVRSSIEGLQVQRR